VDIRLLDFIKYDCFRAELGADHPETIKERNRLALENHGLARKVAHYYASRSAMPYEDLEQIAFLGLIKAIERFDPFKGNQFSSLALPFIRGEVLHYLRDKGSPLSGVRNLLGDERALAFPLSLDCTTMTDDGELTLLDVLPNPSDAEEVLLIQEV
jgi:RNA polymerase sigma factor (sigma-70 family)